MESNPSQTFFYRYGILFIGLLFSIILIANFLMGKEFLRDGEPIEFNVYDLASVLIFPLLIVMLGIFLKDRVVTVKLGGQHISLSQGDYEEEFEWNEVKRIRRLWFIQPPLYVLRIKDGPGYYLFATGLFSVNLFGFIWDPSDMSDLLIGKGKCMVLNRGFLLAFSGFLPVKEV